MATVAPVVVASLLTASALALTVPALAGRTHTITIARMQFQPATLTVREGDTVEWVNDDLVPHTATSSAGGFDSGTMPPGQRWRWTVRSRGTIAYVCSLHPGMSARLDVP